MPSLVGGAGGLVCNPVGKADLLTYHLDSSPGSLLICHPLAIRLLFFLPFPSGRERSGIPC